VAKELPYFQFEPAEYLTKDVSFCSLSAQGLFINICSFYWQRKCELTKEQFLRRFNYIDEFNELVKEGIIDVIDEKIVIKFLLNQYLSVTNKSLINSENGAKGGRPKKQTETETKPNENPNESELKGIREDNIKENNKKEYEIKKNQLLGLYNEVKNTASFEGVKMALNSIVNQKLNYDLMANDFINFAITQDKTYKKPIDFSNHFQNYYKTKELTKYFIIENNNDIDFDKVLEVYNRVFKRNQTYLTNEEKNIVIKAFNDFGKEKINKALENASKDPRLKREDPNKISFDSYVQIKYLFSFDTLHRYHAIINQK